MKKRLLAILLAGLTATQLLACTKTEETAEVQEEQNDGDTAEAETEELQTEAPGTLRTESTTNQLMDTTGTVALYEVTADQLYIDGENVEALQSAFDTYLNQTFDEANYTEVLAQAQSDYETFEAEQSTAESVEEESTETEEATFPTYQDITTIEETRFDSVVTSVTSTQYVYLGGAHGSSYVTGYNFDSQTGELLELEDVVTDEESFITYAQDFILDYLVDVYGEDGLVEDYEELVTAAMEDPNWIFTDYGMTFIFGESELSAYAAGTIEVRIPYEKLEDYLVEKYESYAEQYLLHFAQDEVLYVGGKTASVAVESNEDTGAEELIFHYGNGEFVISEGGSYCTGAHLLYYDDNHTFVLVDIGFDGGDMASCLVWIQDGSATIADMISARAFSNDDITLDGFTLYECVDVLGSYYGSRYYTLESGKFVTEDTDYTFYSADGVEPTGLLTIADITVYVDEEEKTLPIGTTIYGTGCNFDEQKFYFETEYGTTGYLLFEGEKNSGEYTIDGVDQYQVFETLPYAG